MNADRGFSYGKLLFLGLTNGDASALPVGFSRSQARVTGSGIVDSTCQRLHKQFRITNNTQPVNINQKVQISNAAGAHTFFRLRG